MDVYASEKEQLELLKQLWNNYGKSLVAGVVIALIISFGWRYWVQKQHEFTERASILYQQLLITSFADANSAEQLGQQLTNDYKKTPYAAAGQLQLAKLMIAQNKVDLAIPHLQWALDNANVKSLREVARIRLAKVLLSQQKTAQALALLQTVDDTAFQTESDEVKGDIYRALGNHQQARIAYQAALAEQPKVEVMRPLLQMKLNDV